MTPQLRLVTSPERHPAEQLLLRPVVRFVEAECGAPFRVRLLCRRLPLPRRQPAPLRVRQLCERVPPSLLDARATPTLEPRAHPYAPRRQRSGPRPHSLGSRGLTSHEKAELYALEAELRAEGAYDARPTTFAACPPPDDPCPWARCRHHIAVEVDLDILKLNFPGRDLDDLEETCSLRAAMGARPQGLSLDATGRLLNLTQEMVRRIEARALVKLQRRRAALARELDGGDGD